MAMEGMNVDAVRRISRDLKTQAGLLNGVSVRIDGFLDRTQNQWRGTDATDFQSWWRNQHRGKILQLVHDLEGLAQSLWNNADEQDRASGGSSSPGRTGPTTESGGSSSAGQPPHGVTGTGEGAGALAAKLTDELARKNGADTFRAENENHTIDTDGNGAWCFDVFRKYSTDVLHAPSSMASGKYSDAASDIYKQYGSNETQNYYDRIPFGTESPQAGDIIVYDAIAPWNTTYGHVGLVVEGGDQFTTLEQAVNGSDTAITVPRSTLTTPGILGYLRPKAHS